LMGARSFVVTPELAAEVGRVWEDGAPADWDPPLPPALNSLGLVPRTMCAPHFNRVFPSKWLEHGLLPEGYTLIGIDEQTALVNTHGVWEVRGRGAITIIRADLTPWRYATGETVPLTNIGEL